MKRTGRVYLSFWDGIRYFEIPIFFLLIFISINIFDNWRVQPPKLDSYISLFYVPLIFLPGLIQFLRLRFTMIKGNFTEAVFQEALKRTAREMHCSIESNTADYGRISTEDNMLTVIRTDHYILSNCTLNAIESGNKNQFNVLEAGRIKLSFNKHLQEVKQGMPAPTYVQVDENQWSLKRIVIRIIAYVAFIVPIYMAIQIPGSAFFLVISALCSYYIYIDTKLVIRQLKGISPKE